MTYAFSSPFPISLSTISIPCYAISRASKPDSAMLYYFKRCPNNYRKAAIINLEDNDFFRRIADRDELVSCAGYVTQLLISILGWYYYEKSFVAPMYIIFYRIYFGITCKIAINYAKLLIARSHANSLMRHRCKKLLRACSMLPISSVHFFFVTLRNYVILLLRCSAIRKISSISSPDRNAQAEATIEGKCVEDRFAGNWNIELVRVPGINEA